MQYIKINSDTYIEYNEETKESRTYIKSDIEQEIQALTETITNVPTNAELLVWAKDHHPQYVESKQLEQDKQGLETILNQLK